MNEQLILIAIGAVAAAFILRPLWQGRTNRAAVKPLSPAPTAAPSEELSELELDRAMGRVSDEDYAKWRRELETAAPPEPSPADAAPVGPAAQAEALVRQWREAPRPVCPKCGIRPEAGARFCSNCGTSLAS